LKTIREISGQAVKHNGITIISKNGSIVHHYSKKNGTGQGLTDDRIRFLFKDSKNNIWAGTYGGGLNLFNQTSGRFQQIQFETAFTDGSSHNFLLCMEEDNSGNLWIGTENGGLSIYNPATKKSVTYQHIDNDDSSIGSNTINCIKRDVKGNMWMGTSNAGISLVSIDEGSFVHYKYEHGVNSLSNNIVNAIFEDRTGKVWIGTDGGGLNMFDPVNRNFKYFTHHATTPGIAGNYVLSINEDENNLWIGTWGDGITLFNYKNKTYRHFKNQPENTASLSSNYAFFIYRDSKKRMWVGTYGGGLNLYNDNTDTFTRFTNGAPKSISSNYVLTIQEDNKGDIWIGTDGGGLNKYNNDGTFTTYTTTKVLNKGRLSNNTVSSVWADNQGNLWLGTSFGLNCFNPTTLINKAYFAENGLANDAIGAVLGDRQGFIWISTNKGLSRLDPKKQTFTNFSTADGLQADEFKYARCIDHSGRMYFGGRNGFNVFTPDKIRSVAFDPPVVFTNFQLFNKDVTVARDGEDDSPLKTTVSMAKRIVLSYKQSSFSFEFASLNYTSAEKKQYAYKLDGYDNQWHNLGTRNSLTYTNLDPGSYKLIIRGLNNNKQWSANTSQIEIIITPPFWKTWWFKVLILTIIIGAVTSLFYLRLANIRNRNRQLEKEVNLRTQQLSETNAHLLESYEEIKLQNENLEEVNKEIIRKTDKILHQQEQIVVQNRQLELTVNELEVSNQTKDKFFSILAHDLRNPIAALSGLADLLKARLGYLNQNEIISFVHDISRSSNSVHNLVINLLDWARTQSKNLQYQPSNINVHELVMKNVHLAQIQLTNKNIKCEVYINPAHSIFADYQMINTVIRNILGNSIKFTPVSGHISINSEELHGNVAITVKDSGIGMSAGQIEQLTQPQLQGSLGTAGETGTGLGLQICRDFIRANNGELHITSIPGKGSVITVKLAQSTANSAAAPLPVLTSNEVSDATDTSFADIERLLPDIQKQVLKGKRILIVDDNPEIRNYLKALLAGIFEIFEAEDGLQGIKTAKEAQPDLIISDLIMPVMNGLEFCNLIKGNIITSHIPVLLLTGETTEDSQVSGYEAGADIYLTKPVNKQILFRVIFNFIRSLEKIRSRFAVTDQLIPDNLDYNKLDKEFLEKMSQYIELNLSNSDLDYKMLSEHAAMSRTVLYSKFKTLTGMGVHDFIKNIRLKKALNHLLEGKLNISQIAYEVGFATPSYFSKSFTKQYKVTPKEYVLSIKKTTDTIHN
jgi:signal transduction histidine kinase/ligand-binding sensor domain-containing protein/CheY-like chemotaxis protein